MCREIFLSKRNAFLFVEFLVVFCFTAGCFKAGGKLEKRDQELILEEENEFRKRAAQTLGCTDEEIGERLPDLTLEKVHTRYLDRRYKSFGEVAESFREDLCVDCLDSKNSWYKDVILFGGGVRTIQFSWRRLWIYW